MAENRKPPHDRPPLADLADKGAARPLSQPRPGATGPAKPDDEKRPSGLHTRPDLFGSSAVMRRPDDEAAEKAGAPGPESASPDPSKDPGQDRPSESSAGAAPAAATQATRIGRPMQGDEAIETPEAPGRRATPVGVFLPVANLQDQPLRIPDSLAFEDWPDTEQDAAGARSPEGASMATAEPGTQAPAPSEADSTAAEPARPDLGDPNPAGPKTGAPVADDLAVPEKPAEAAAPPDWQAPDWQAPDGQAPNRQADPSAGQPDRFRHLLARLETGIDLRRLSDTRWLLPAGIAACAVLLVAGLAVGIVPIPGDDRQTGQLAQDLDAPAAGDPEASAPLAGQQDLPVAPAGSEPDNESAVKPLPEEAAPGDEPGTSQLAALPEPGAPTALDSDREPIVDFMRIDPDGKAVVAGRAAPGTKLTVLDNGEPLGTVTADIYGLWTFVSKDPLSGGRHEIGLRVKNQGSEVSSEPVLVTDGGSSPIQGPESRAEPEGPVTNTPEGADFSRDLAEDFKAPEQLAAAAPGPSVRSDAAVPPGRAETDESAAEEAIVAPSRDDQGEIAATPTPIEDSLQAIEQEPVEPAAGPAEQAAEETLEVTAAEPAAAEAAATATAPAPAPKPEPPAETQIARTVPTGGDYVIQFASFLNPETAVREQALLEERFSDLLAGHDVFVQQVDIADQGTFYRVRLGPFATLAEARATCTRFQERERDCLAMAR